MKITKEWIKKWELCKEAVKWLKQQDAKDVFELIKRLRKSDISDKHDWLFWAIPRLLRTKRARIKFAVYCAQLALPIFEEEFPKDKRPRKSIQAVKNWIKNPTEKNRAAAWAAADAAWDAAGAAWDAAGAAWDAGDAGAAVWAAWAAGYAGYTGAAWAAARAADGYTGAAARAAAWAAKAAAGAAAGSNETKDKIIDYGIKLLKGA